MIYTILIAAAISAFGQVLLKYAMLKHGSIDFNLQGLIRLIIEWRLICALGLYAAALLMWLHVLSKVPLSIAYPMLAITYVIVPLMSFAFFGERINQPQIIGICLVLAGVAIIGKTA
ncbi:SMR family transporter [Methylomonas rapida]|uniref:EamA family transporter n=1 Tax=Methylomonas rapida TaxID=2963939 RepID=A0ABY7GQ28_9GAMM|nr:SMR family transporter [Methylomonas rapida]WAR46603.1 EamA family transporter [Methylomonas rapida]